MKHLYLEPKFRSFNLSRSNHAMRQRQRAAESKGTSGHALRVERRRLEKPHTLQAPSRFSLTQNARETQEFFHKLDFRISKKMHTFVDLAGVTDLTPDAVLTLLAMLDRAANAKSLVSGNAPDSPKIRQIFLHSGFYQYVQSSHVHQVSTDILSIETGEKVDPVTAGAVVKFARSKLLLTDRKLTTGLYTTIMETMINVEEHAYSGRKFDKWYLMALHDSSCHRVHFALVDNGKGIPTTVRKKITDIMGNDAELLVSTLNGEERSQTKKAYRGNGLPKVKGYADNKKIENLFVISRNGFYDVGRDIRSSLAEPFLGTLISWDFIPEKHDDDQCE